jgi:hypothetical protein
MLLSMCMMCNGATLDDFLFHVHGLITRFGWAVVPVGDGSRAWAYTIGLVEVNHPELVVMGMPPERAGTLLNSLAARIREGSEFLDGERVAVGTEHYRIAPVSDRHFMNGRLGMWVNYYGALGPPRPEPRALEVVPQGKARRLS